MGFLLDRLGVIGIFFGDLARFGLAESTGRLDREVVFILDGVGRFQAAVLMVRRALRETGSEMGTVYFDWQFGLPGEIWTDLMWHRRNQLMGRKLARKLLGFRRAHPETTIHLLAFSGGAGIAAFACEQLRGREVIDTLVLGCPALSPGYNLGPALGAVKRCYALVSAKDTWILGLGTRIFGTTDRAHVRAAGLAGFRIPDGISSGDVEAYQRFGEIHWTPALRAQGHRGGHIGWGRVPFLKTHLLSLLSGRPKLPVKSLCLGA